MSSFTRPNPVRAAATLIGLGAIGSAFAQQDQQPPKNHVDLTSPPAVERNISSYKNLANAWDLPKQWRHGTTVYTIGGNTILSDSKAKDLGDWVAKNYPNWTIVVTEPAWTQAYAAAQEKSRELFYSPSFGEIVDPKTKLQSGNLLLIAYKAGNRNDGATMWFSSPLMGHYGLSAGATWTQNFQKFANDAAGHKNVTLAVKLTIPEIENALQKKIDAELAAKHRGENIKVGVEITLGIGALGIAAFALAKRRNSQLQRIQEARNYNKDAIDKITKVVDSYLEIDRRSDELAITDPQFVSNLSYASLIFDFLTNVKSEALSEFGTGKAADSQKTLTVERLQMSEAFATEYQRRNNVDFAAITLEEALSEWSKVESELKQTLGRADPMATYEASQQDKNVSA